MALHRIYTKNAEFQGLEVLRANRNKRHRRRAFIVEGVRNITEARRGGWRFEALIHADGPKLTCWAADMLASAPDGVDIYALTPELMAKLSAKADTSELLAVVRMRDLPSRNNQEVAAPTDLRGLVASLSENPLLALFDRPSNKGNLGTVLRSCDAFGVETLFYSGHSVDVYDPEVVAASMGSFFAVPFAPLREAADIDRLFCVLRERYPGIVTVGTSAHGERMIDTVDMTGPVLLLIGNETDGLSWRLSHMCDVVAAIPMSESASASSLNVSCAAAVMFYEAARQRIRG